MINHGMYVCSFGLRKRFQMREDSLQALNHPYTFQMADKEFSMDNAVEMFRSFCVVNKEYTDDKKRRKVFSVKEGSFCVDYSEAYSAVSFVIKSGGYGVESEITDRTTNQVTYRRSANESDVKEFLCVVYIPQDIGNLQIYKGIFVFQSIGNYGVKTITTERMRLFFADRGLTLDTRSVSVSAFLEKLIEQGKLHRITLIRNYLSPNMADCMLISTGREERTFINPVLQVPFKEKMFSKFRKADASGIIEIPMEGDYDDILFQFEMGGKKRTVRFSNLDKLSIIEDIPEAVVQNNDHCEIRKYMIKTAKEYKDRMVWGHPSEVV